MKFCLAFNGQGKQDSELFLEFIHSNTEFGELIKSTNAILGEDIVKIIEDSELLNKAKYAQISTFVINHCAYLLMKDQYKLSPSVAIGHSLGHYNALVASRCISYENALKIVKRRAELTEQIVDQSDGTGMFGISGADIDMNEIMQLCNDLSDEKRFVGIAIMNTPQNIVLSFYNYHVEEILDYFGDYRVSIMKVPAPYHSKAMLSAVPAFMDKLYTIEFKDPTITVISNVTGKPLNKGQIRNDLIQHLIAPINMYQCVQYFAKIDVTVILEASLFRVISKIASRNHAYEVYNMIYDIDKFLKESENKQREYNVCLEMMGQLMSIPDIDKYMDIKELKAFYYELKEHKNSNGKDYKGNPLLYQRYQSIISMNSREAIWQKSRSII